MLSLCVAIPNPMASMNPVLPYSSVGKESACSAGDPGLIPGSGRSSGEGIGYLIQYSWASLLAQLVKNPSAKRETWVPSLGWEDPLEKGTATHPSILAWRIPWTTWSMGLQRVRQSWAIFAFFTIISSSQLKLIGLDPRVSGGNLQIDIRDSVGYRIFNF